MTPPARTFDRRTALVAIAAVVAAPLTLLRADAAGRPRRPASGAGVVYRLDPVHHPGAGRCDAGCAGCEACRRHARNKIFATAEAADAHRAHKGCRCRVVKSQLPAATAEKLFGAPGKPARVSVDRRWPWVREALAPARRASR